MSDDQKKPRKITPANIPADEQWMWEYAKHTPDKYAAMIITELMFRLRGENDAKV